MLKAHDLRSSRSRHGLDGFGHVPVESFALAQSSVYVSPPVDKGNPPFRTTADLRVHRTTVFYHVCYCVQ